jgi:hypothetical protein
MLDLSKISAPCDIHDLLNLTRDDFDTLDARVTSHQGRPGKGDRVVIWNTATRRDVSVALNDFEVDALLLKVSTAWPDTMCNLHRPYDRSRKGRRFYDMFAVCSCAKVFHSRLLQSRVTAAANALHVVVGELRELRNEIQAM